MLTNQFRNVYCKWNDPPSNHWVEALNCKSVVVLVLQRSQKFPQQRSALIIRKLVSYCRYSEVITVEYIWVYRYSPKVAQWSWGKWWSTDFGLWTIHIYIYSILYQPSKWSSGTVILVLPLCFSPALAAFSSSIYPLVIKHVNGKTVIVECCSHQHFGNFPLLRLRTPEGIGNIKKVNILIAFQNHAKDW